MYSWKILHHASCSYGTGSSTEGVVMFAVDNMEMCDETTPWIYDRLNRGKQSDRLYKPNKS